MPDRHYRVGVYIAPSPLTQEQSYFEVEILDHGANKCIGEWGHLCQEPVFFVYVYAVFHIGEEGGIRCMMLE